MPSSFHVPKERHDVLVFDIERGGRPSYNVRGLHPTSGQSYGVGAIYQPKIKLTARDEDVSARRGRLPRAHRGQRIAFPFLYSVPSL
jgi:hypothetical protein